jgi:hypothetical protein
MFFGLLDPDPLVRGMDSDSDPLVFNPVLLIRIWDPGLGTFLTPGSRIRDGRKSASGSGIRDEQPGSYFLEHRNHFFLLFGWLKYLI